VYLIDSLVLCQVLTLLGPAVHHGQEVLGDGLGEGFLQKGTQIGVYRVHLEKADLTFVEELRDHIHRRD
jgi:hypothetical protein